MAADLETQKLVDEFADNIAAMIKARGSIDVIVIVNSGPAVMEFASMTADPIKQLGMLAMAEHYVHVFQAHAKMQIRKQDEEEPEETGRVN